MLTLGASKESKQVNPFDIFHRQVGFAIYLTGTEHLDDVRVSNGLIELCFVHKHIERVVALGVTEHPLDDKFRGWVTATSRTRQKDLGAAAYGKPPVEPERPKRLRAFRMVA